MKWGKNEVIEDNNENYLIDLETKEFRRGKYSGYTLDNVSSFDTEYLIFLAEEAPIDEESKNLVQDFLESEGII